MYTPDQIAKGLRRPSKVTHELGRQWRRCHAYLPHEIGVQGSYRTGNVGDRAIGERMREELSNMGYRAKIFEKRIERSSAPVRILGGGGVLHDWYGIDHLRARLNFLSDGGAVIGVGVPGFESTESRSLVSRELASADLVTVRDEWSRKRLEPYYDGEIHTTACPALLHEDPRAPSSGRTGVNFRPWFHLDEDVMERYFDYSAQLDCDRARARYLENIASICDELSDPVFIPFHETDERFARRHLDVEIMPYEFSVGKTLERVSAVDRLVTMRYHSLVFAVVCETPVLVLAYEPKVSALADRVGVPSAEPHGDIPLTFEPISSRQAVRDAARENFERLGELLGNGPADPDRS